jgi:hypothetical protein
MKISNTKLATSLEHKPKTSKMAMSYQKSRPNNYIERCKNNKNGSFDYY